MGVYAQPLEVLHIERAVSLPTIPFFGSKLWTIEPPVIPSFSSPPLFKNKIIAQSTPLAKLAMTLYTLSPQTVRPQ